jgi:metal-responsive CopG/Arc/MetJ family transcriptional regulator
MESGTPVRANLSMDSGLLAAVDEAADRAGMTRSAFLADAARRKSLTGA